MDFLPYMWYHAYIVEETWPMGLDVDEEAGFVEVGESVSVGPGDSLDIEGYPAFVGQGLVVYWNAYDEQMAR